MSQIQNHISRRQASPRPSPPSPLTRATTPSASNSSINADDDDDNIDDLPYPLPLPRSPFTVTPSQFSAPAYLSTLSHRHQTLSDLRSDLRARSQLIARELLDLVNGNYTDFLSLGQALQGGEERVEEVRVGVLGLRGALGDVRSAVLDREGEVQELVRERERVGRAVRTARGLLEVERGLGECEDALGVAQGGAAAAAASGAWAKHNSKSADGDENIANADASTVGSYSTSDSESDSDDSSSPDEQAMLPSATSLPRLRRLVRQYLSIRQQMAHIGPDHPFLVAQEPRLVKIRNTLLLDLGAALKHARAAGEPGKGRVLRILSVYEEMDEGGEAVGVLKGERG
ncbi:oligomeric golgi complex component, COG2-domain-containing protein [Phyllosticta capitalensis]